MKNKFHDATHQASHLSSKDTELRIKMYRQAWQEGKLKIDSKRLAEKMTDFETRLDNALSGSSTSQTGKSRQ